MIALVLSMLGARRAQAITVWLLSAVVTAAAVAGPVAVREVDRAIATKEVTAASTTERSLSVTAFLDPSDSDASAQFDAIAALVDLPGFDAIRAGELEAFGPVADGSPAEDAPTSRVVFRERVCEHLQMVAGRCATGPLEIVVGVDSARKVVPATGGLGATAAGPPAGGGLRPGDVAVVQAAKYVLGRGLVPDGPPTRLTVVGLYEVRDPAEAYWAGQRYFPVQADGTRHEAIFATPQTFDLIGHTLGQSSVDSLAPTSVLTVARLAGLRAELERITTPLASQPTLVVNTDLPALADRVEGNRAAARALVPVAFLPLVALCFFVIYLAVGYGIFGRRQELGLVALRGVLPARRWWLATGETAVAIVAGTPAGYLLGYGGVNLVAAARFDGPPVPVTTAAVPYAGLALAGALVVALVGQRRAVGEPVADLLRGVPRGTAAWRGLAVEVLILVLAALATVQLRVAEDGLRGVALLVPGLVVVAVALVTARIFTPLAALVARRALRGGRLGLGLAAVQLARRPGSQRLFVLIAVASAMLAFIVAGMDVAATGRADRARIVTGADRVLTLDAANVRTLLHVTRTVDPAGAWAMAAIAVPQTFPGAPRLLGVDASRLGAVADWRPEFGATAAAVMAALRPPPAQPLVFRGKQIELDLETYRMDTSPRMDLGVHLAPLAGGEEIVVAVTDLAPGRAVRRLPVTGCGDGCRLASLVVTVDGSRGQSVRLAVHRIAQLDPGADVAPVAVLTRRNGWRAAPGTIAAPGSGALLITANPSQFESADVTVAPVDTPLPVPVIAAGSLAGNSTISSLDGSALLAKPAVPAMMLPRLGNTGVLADLEYLERAELAAPRQVQAEVWLGPAAPVDAAGQLRRAGLAVSGETGVAENRGALDRQGTALALQFHLAAAVFGVALGLGGLGLVATVDRRRRAYDLYALRQQGLDRATVRRAALWGYLAIVVLAAVAGLLAATVAWLAAGDRLPVFTDALTAVGPPRWPRWWAVGLAWGGATSIMVVGSVVAASALRRASMNGARSRRG